MTVPPCVFPMTQGIEVDHVGISGWTTSLVYNLCVLGNSRTERFWFEFDCIKSWSIFNEKLNVTGRFSNTFFFWTKPNCEEKTYIWVSVRWKTKNEIIFVYSETIKRELNKKVFGNLRDLHQFFCLLWINKSGKHKNCRYKKNFNFLFFFFLFRTVNLVNNLKSLRFRVGKTFFFNITGFFLPERKSETHMWIGR